MSTQTLTHDNSTLLRRALLGNTAFSAITGLACVLGAWPLAALMGLPSPFILVALGAGLLGYAALLYRLAQRRPIPRAGALIIVAADVAWVLINWVLLLGGWVAFTPAGWWIVAVVADIVALFAIVQFIGVRQMGR
jgi:hypothetical protein